jgi:ribose transport system permease protein
MGTFVSGIALWISNSTEVSGVAMSLVNAVVVDRLFGISLEFYYLIIIALVMWYFLEFTPPGRRALVVGKGREVARLSGLRVGRIRLLSFVAAGLLSGLAGVVYVGTSGSADPSAGTALLLPAFAAVFLGSTVLYPGRFNPWGTLVAVYFLTTGIDGLAMLGVSTFVQQLFYGGALIVAVLLSSLTAKSRKSRLRKESV